MRGDILERLGAVVREQEAAREAAEAASTAAVLEFTRGEAILTTALAQTRPRPRPPSLSRRVLPFAVLSVLAAAVIVAVVPWWAPVPSPEARNEEAMFERVADASSYTVHVSGGSRGRRGAGVVERFHPGQRVRIEAVPERAVAGMQELRVIGVHEGVEHHIKWPSRAIAPEKGIFTVEGPAEDLARMGHGSWSLRVELIRRTEGSAQVLAEIEILVDTQ